MLIIRRWRVWIIMGGLRGLKVYRGRGCGEVGVERRIWKLEKVVHVMGYELDVVFLCGLCGCGMITDGVGVDSRVDDYIFQQLVRLVFVGMVTIF